MNWKWRTLTLVIVVWLTQPMTAGAHGLHTHYQSEESVTVDFSFEDHTPMAFESYEILPPDDEVPFQVGRTNRLGQCVFHPDRPGLWQVRVWTEDGHGATVRIEVDENMLVGTVESHQPSRWSKMIMGLSVLFGVFGVVSLFSRRKKG